MNWRRGLLFAGIHLAICFGLVVWSEAGYWRQFEASSASDRAGSRYVSLDTDQAATAEESVTVRFDCRSLWYHMPLQERIIRILELPPALISGWHEPCPLSWTLSEALNLNAPRHTRSKQIASASILLVSIIVQWLFVGGLPLVHPRTWYLEPGSCITVCLVFLSGVAVFESLLERAHFPWIEGVMLVPGLLGLLAMALGLLAWLSYFLLLLWKPVHLAWQSTLHSLPRLRN